MSVTFIIEGRTVNEIETSVAGSSPKGDVLIVVTIGDKDSQIRCKKKKRL